MFRPSFETLERREVFSAGPLAVTGNTHANGTFEVNLVPAITVNAQGGNDLAVRVAAGDVNGDGRPDLLSPQDGTSNTLMALLLPYMEQDNLYRSSANAALDIEGESTNASRQTDGDSDGADFLMWNAQAQLAADFDGDDDVDGADFLIWQRTVGREVDRAAHDAVFAEIGFSGGVRVGLMDGSVRGISNIADGTSDMAIVSRRIRGMDVIHAPR